MRTSILTVLTGIALLGLGSAGFAANDTTHATQVPQMGGNALEQVDSFTARTGIDGWRALDGDTLIVWATPTRPYLLELDRNSTDLPFVENIGITMFNGVVRANIDEVRVRGVSYPIKKIYKLNEEQAQQLREAS
jgi:hypothetical protein